MGPFLFQNTDPEQTTLAILFEFGFSRDMNYSKKSRRSWLLYDWANSAFATTVMAGFFPLFFQQYWSQGAETTLTTARLGVANSVAALVTAVLVPVLGAIGDARSLTKRMVLVSTLFGTAGTLMLSRVGMGDWQGAALWFALASIGFHAACAFYDALLPRVAHAEEMHVVSGKGYAVGYLGGGVLFALNVAMFLKPEIFGLRDGTHAVLTSFVSVAVWWIVFSIPLFLNVNEPPAPAPDKPVSQITRGLWQDTLKIAREASATRGVGLFFIAYWIYIDGIYSVMKMAVDYGVAIGLPSSALITALLLVQFVGFPSAWVMGHLGEKWGAKKSVLLGLVVYTVAVFFAFRMTTSTEFYVLACAIGLVQGGVQSLSRSMFGMLIPAEKSGEFFGLFNLVGRFATILGPTLMGVTAWILGSPRYGMLSLTLLFVVGGALLWRVKFEKLA